MSGVWQIRLKSAAGALVGVIDDYDSCYFVNQVNTPGAFGIDLDASSSKCALFELDGQVEFWRRDQELSDSWTLEGEYLFRGATHVEREDGAVVYRASGVGYASLLNRRIIAASAGSAGAAKSGKAETVAKAFVEEQCGPTAGARALSGFSAEADGAHGNDVTLARAYRKVLEVVQEIASIGGGDFAVVGSGAATFQFRWYNGQLGTDKHVTVIFQPELGNMVKPMLVEHRHEEITAVLVGGQGEGALRTATWRTDAARIALSPWNRIELFRDQRQESDADGLNSTGDAALEEGTPRPGLTFQVVQTPGCAYREHYTLGDLVTAKFLSYSQTHQIVRVSVTVNKDGEQIDVLTEEHT